jgi:NADPH2 dehydrogenase
MESNMSGLFSEISIRNLKIKNRIVMPPMACSGFTGEDGLFKLNNIERYRDRARGGVGLIIVEATAISQGGRFSPIQLGLWNDGQIKGFSRLAAYCREYDCRVLAQISHAGLAAVPPAETAATTAALVAPSDFQGLSRSNRKIQARALTLAEIGSIQEEYVAAALRAKQAGLDGVELQGADGYLISQFFSPLVNLRQDEYGGDPIKRTRFAREIAAAIRRAAGPDFVIALRMGCDEPDLECSLEVARQMEGAGIDLLHIARGMSEYLSGHRVEVEVPKYFHYNSVVYRGALIKAQLKTPVILGNGIQNPLDAAFLVEHNYADLVAIGRGLLVDPEWAIKGQQYKQVTNCLRCKTCSYHSRGSACPQTRVKKFNTLQQ